MPLKVELVAKDWLKITADVLAVPVTSDWKEGSPLVDALDGALGGGLLQHLEENAFRAKLGSVLSLPSLGRLKVKKLVLVGCGESSALNEAALREYAAVALRSAASGSVVLVNPSEASAHTARTLSEGAVLGAYRFDKYRTDKSLPGVTGVMIAWPKKLSKAEKDASDLGIAIAEAICVSRDLVNEPPNVLTPIEFAARASEVAKQGKLKVKILDKAGIAKAGMNLHYAVGQGSANEPRFIHLSYIPKGAKKSIAFVGKGLTFDAGGICIKPAGGMEDMKSDMGGAAAVLGMMQAVAALQPDVAVHGIIGAAENMLGSEAYRPSDVFKSMNGKTVEIINTDAEGRLVLADALEYAARLKVDAIVDAATLTGACMVALGRTCSAFYTDHEDLAKRFDKAHRAADEQFWRMPLLKELKSQLRSNIADLKHCGDRWGGSITAALFLQEFVGDTPWIHCDIPSMVMLNKPQGVYPKGGTGHPVLTFLKFIEEFSSN